MKRPSLQFYPADWLNDTGLRACTLAARGLWIDAMCHMHQGTPYGHLTFASVKDGGKDGGKDIPKDVLARMVGSDVQEVERLLTELEAAGVFSRTADGVIFSRRMVNDERLRQVRAESGFKSLSNPKVPRPKGDGRISGRTTARISSDPSTQMSLGGSPSSSSSSSKPSSAKTSQVDESDSIDPRHAPLRGLIQKLHLDRFRVTCEWDGGEGKALNRVLEANPSWTLEAIERMVRNRFHSDELKSDRPKLWLSRVGEFAAGPQDRYGKPKAQPPVNGSSRKPKWAGMEDEPEGREVTA
jgi:hypothetical protein